MVRRPPRVTGIIAPGAPIAAADDPIDIPPDRIAPGEQVLRLAQDLPEIGLAAGDLLIAEPRSHAATGELVIVTLHERAYIGRWWAKHGRRALLDNEFRSIVEAPELLVLGAVTLIARDENV